MPFCGTCGAPVDGRFCGKCGSAVAAPPGAAHVGAGSQPVAAGAPLADNVASALCYLVGLVTGIIFLVISPYSQNRTIRFHAFQAIFVHVGIVAVYIGFGFLTAFLPVPGLFFLWPLIWLGAFVLWIYMLVSTYQGKQVELPVVGPLARQQA